jgi:hypothetical protein
VSFFIEKRVYFKKMNEFIVKAGFLMKRSRFLRCYNNKYQNDCFIPPFEAKILRNWKKKWFSLTNEGYFRCFEDKDKPIAEHTLYMPNVVKEIKVGMSNKTPPDGHSSGHIIEIKCYEKDDWVLCADSLDDML